MEQHVFVSKLIPPTPTNYYLRKANLMKKLTGWHQAKCTILHSSAGYGKTSLISQFIQDSNTSCAWYQITSDDDSIFPFLRHFIYSVQQNFPSFGENLKGWDLNIKFHNVEELLQLSKQLVNEFHKITIPFIMVLDDYHHVSHVFSINYVMNQLLQYLPRQHHLIVASRKMPEWSCLLHLRMNNQLIECFEHEFVFSEDDVQFLFETYFERKVSDKECEFVMQMTEGWAMAVMLLAYQAKYSPQKLVDIAQGNVVNFFAYLSAEVFEKLDEQFQQDLLKVGIHQVISLEELTELYGADWVKGLQDNLKNLAFVIPLAGGTKYRFHALFQHFLQQRLQEHAPALFEQYHEEAANYYASHQQGIQAVSHAAQLKNKTYYATHLLQFSQQFIEAGQFDYLLDRLKDLSQDEKNYQLLFYEGESQRYRAQYEKAKNAYMECFHKAQSEQDLLYMMRAQFGLANIYLDTLQPVFAEHHLQQTIELLMQVDVSEEESQQINSYYTENLINLGRAGEAQRWSNGQNLKLSLNNIDARMYLRQGQLEQAKEILQQRVVKQFRWEEAHRTTDLLLVLIDVLMGENEQAYARIIESEKEQLVDMPFTLAIIKLRKGLALLNMDVKDLTLAKQCLDETLELMGQIHVKRVKAECYMGLVLFHRDNVNEAKRYAQMGLRETEKVQDYWMSALLLTALTKVLVENEHYEEAIETAKQALAYYTCSEDSYGQMICSFWLAVCNEQLGRRTQAIQDYEVYWNLCSEKYPYFIKRRTLFGPQRSLLFIRLAQRLEKQHELFVMMAAENVPNTQLHLTLFGPVSIQREQQVVHDKEWKRMKAKELFLYLYSCRDQFVTKQQLCEVIWNYDEEAMVRDFKVVYNAMLKTLEPNRSAREESHFIIRRQHLYKLDTAWIQSDVALFEYYMQKGFDESIPKISNEWLKLAIRFVDSPFCSDIDRDWVNTLRVYYEEQAIKVMERLAQNYVRLQSFTDVIYYANRMRTIDDGYEEAYRLLILAHYYLGNRREALKIYDECVKVLDEQYELPPMETTEQLYDLILKM
ncbi:BTAD domain-containing putative transcriptional regulator [Solibacillus daqui]|uniref:BTAD domain-containing putative transcriptional regulator n=1 Tax=Solibacillus daqui TaxID=2912187 RepID=UPI002366E919|nr:BTAD domain-containing putative transcriptional regulator [Solibacillus daqui]